MHNVSMYELLPKLNCDLCPRLADFREENRKKFPEFYNAPVPSFGCRDAELLIVGLAPGLKGANFSGRPFTGDYAGDLLYATLLEFGFAKGDYAAQKSDGLELVNARITNAVKCVPPENKPTGTEIKTCRSFLKTEFETMPKLKVILSLGLISHNAVVVTSGYKQSAFKFVHGAMHDFDNGIKLIDSYHCSRYNTNTGRLTTQMFHDIFQQITDVL